MANLASIIQSMREQGIPETITRNTLAQFGDKARAYLGATIFPEKTVPQNSYREEQMRFRTIIAPDSSRYGSVQRRGADLYASFLVELANSNIGADITAADYEALLRMSQSNLTMEAIVRMTNWMDIRINRALIENNERMRWEFLVSGRVTRTGDGGYREIVDYGVPLNQRISFAPGGSSTVPMFLRSDGTTVGIDASPSFGGGGSTTVPTYNGVSVPKTAANGWLDPAVDVFDQISWAAQIMIDAGYTPGRMITTRNVISNLTRNATIKARGGVAVVKNGSIVTGTSRVTAASINSMLQDDGLPPFETYELMYRTNLGTRRFFPNGYVIMLANTGREVDLDFPDVAPLLQQLDLFGDNAMRNVLGYTAIGTTTGETAPGRKALMKHIDNLPPAIYAEGWQTSLIVPQEMQAFILLKVF
jgi:Phage major capsid protein E